MLGSTIPEIYTLAEPFKKTKQETDFASVRLGQNDQQTNAMQTKLCLLKEPCLQNSLHA